MRKRTKEEIERIRRKAENDPRAKELRQLVERGKAELEERRRREGGAHPTGR
jgi:hypothetical protein